jgi:hypothetical protein
MMTFQIPTEEEIEQAIGPIERFHSQCHAASLALVRSGLLPGEGWRVARGWARGVGSQHSWAVQGNPYDPKSLVVDITMWSYQKHLPRVYVTRNAVAHEPHGFGHLVPKVVFEPSTPLVTDFPMDKLSPDTQLWFRMRYPQGIGWADFSRLMNGPLLGWPSKEIVSATTGTKLAVMVPIDVRGMLTDENPGELYW